MQLYKYLALLSMIFVGSHIIAQTPQPVKLKGYVYDLYTNKPMRGVSVINPKSGFTYGTDGTGHFEIEINKTDTLFLFCPTYKTIKFSVSDSALHYVYELNLAIEPVSQTTSSAIVIVAPKTLEEIEEERRKLGQTPKELERGEISPFTSPISAIYEMLSQRSKQKEHLKEQIKEDDRRRIFKELLRYYNENALIDLPEENYEDFINYCNLPLEFLKYESDYTITKTIMDAYNKYALNNGLIK
jgi:hypothetical protein